MNSIARRFVLRSTPRSLGARSFVLDGHAGKIDTSQVFNPEWKPEGMEGGVDTNSLPWLPLDQMPGCSIKPLRVSGETGAFTAIVQVAAGTKMPAHVHLGASDTFMLSGKMSYSNGPMQGSIGPGVWGYTPAMAKMEGNTAEEDTEYMATYYGPVAFLNENNAVQSLLTGADVRKMADDAGVQLLPNTLAEALSGETKPYAGAAQPLAITQNPELLSKLVTDVAVQPTLSNPHYVDTNAIPWIINPDAPDIGLKVMRVSAETGSVSLIVRQNGQAPPHYHLGPADFFITSGRIGYRTGPPEGYGPGMYMYEPAGARHEATQRVTDEDLIYTANVWGPIAFDSGVGTPVAAVLSWMEYLAAAKAMSSPLIASSFPNDQSTFLASN